MGSSRRQQRINAGRAWLPPVPTEHGARAMVGVALLTPAAVAIRQGFPPVENLVGFLFLAALAVLVLAFREAVQRRLRAPSSQRRRLSGFVAIEALLMLAFVGGIAWTAGWQWIGAVLVIPAALADVAIRRDGYPVPLGGELAGIFAISLAVPAGGALLDVGGTGPLLALWALFVLFHVEGVTRVKATVRSRVGDASRAVYANLAFHVAGFAGTVAGLVVGPFGPSAPVVFGVATTWALWLSTRDDPPDTPTLGRRERLVSILFVLGAPWLVW